MDLGLLDLTGRLKFFTVAKGGMQLVKNVEIAWKEVEGQKAQLESRQKGLELRLSWDMRGQTCLDENSCWQSE